MMNLNSQDKKLILHSAYLAFLQYEWKNYVFETLSNTERNLIIGKMPCGDAIGNLMTLAKMLLSDFDEKSPIKGEIEKIKEFIYDKNS